MNKLVLVASLFALAACAPGRVDPPPEGTSASSAGSTASSSASSSDSSSSDSSSSASSSSGATASTGSTGGSSASCSSSSSASTGSSGSASTTGSSGSTGGSTSSSSSSSSGSSGTSGAGTLRLPAGNALYTGCFGYTKGAYEAQPSDLDDYVNAVGKPVAWFEFDDEWGRGREFPLTTAEWIRAKGSVPYIRMDLRSDDSTVPDSTFTLQKIANGNFDADLSAWGQAAAAFGTPLIIEYGTEVNGDWMAWNGSYAGANAQATALFRAAYRHIHDVVVGAGATNTTWVFHANFMDWPEASWNAFENYYPGDDVVDWVGISLYASTRIDDGNWFDFVSNMDATVARLDAMAPTKPQFILEFAAPANDPLGDAVSWADGALAAIMSNRWPHLRGFNWWNERYAIDGRAADDTNFLVQEIPGMAAVFQARVADDPKVIGVPIIQ